MKASMTQAEAENLVRIGCIAEGLRESGQEKVLDFFRQKCAEQESEVVIEVLHACSETLVIKACELRGITKSDRDEILRLFCDAAKRVRN